MASVRLRPPLGPSLSSKKAPSSSYPRNDSRSTSSSAFDKFNAEEFDDFVDDVTSRLRATLGLPYKRRRLSQPEQDGLQQDEGDEQQSEAPDDTCALIQCTTGIPLSSHSFAPIYPPLPDDNVPLFRDKSYDTDALSDTREHPVQEDVVVGSSSPVLSEESRSASPVEVAEEDGSEALEDEEDELEEEEAEEEIEEEEEEEEIDDRPGATQEDALEISSSSEGDDAQQEEVIEEEVLSQASPRDLGDYRLAQDIGSESEEEERSTEPEQDIVVDEDAQMSGDESDELAPTPHYGELSRDTRDSVSRMRRTLDAEAEDVLYDHPSAYLDDQDQHGLVVDDQDRDRIRQAAVAEPDLQDQVDARAEEAYFDEEEETPADIVVEGEEGSMLVDEYLRQTGAHEPLYPSLDSYNEVDAYAGDDAASPVELLIGFSQQAADPAIPASAIQGRAPKSPSPEMLLEDARHGTSAIDEVADHRAHAWQDMADATAQDSSQQLPVYDVDAEDAEPDELQVEDYQQEREASAVEDNPVELVDADETEEFGDLEQREASLRSALYARSASKTFSALDAPSAISGLSARQLYQSQPPLPPKVETMHAPVDDGASARRELLRLAAEKRAQQPTSARAVAADFLDSPVEGAAEEPDLLSQDAALSPAAAMQDAQSDEPLSAMDTGSVELTIGREPSPRDVNVVELQAGASGAAAQEHDAGSSSAVERSVVLSPAFKPISEDATVLEDQSVGLQDPTAGPLERAEAPVSVEEQLVEDADSMTDANAAPLPEDDAIVSPVEAVAQTEEDIDELDAEGAPSESGYASTAAESILPVDQPAIEFVDEDDQPLDAIPLEQLEPPVDEEEDEDDDVATVLGTISEAASMAGDWDPTPEEGQQTLDALLVPRPRKQAASTVEQPADHLAEEVSAPDEFVGKKHAFVPNAIAPGQWDPSQPLRFHGDNLEAGIREALHDPERRDHLLESLGLDEAMLNEIADGMSDVASETSATEIMAPSSEERDQLEDVLLPQEADDEMDHFDRATEDGFEDFVIVDRDDSSGRGQRAALSPGEHRDLSAALRNAFEPEEAADSEDEASVLGELTAPRSARQSLTPRPEPIDLTGDDSEGHRLPADSDLETASQVSHRDDGSSTPAEGRVTRSRARHSRGVPSISIASDDDDEPPAKRRRGAAPEGTPTRELSEVPSESSALRRSSRRKGKDKEEPVLKPYVSKRQRKKRAQEAAAEDESVAGGLVPPIPQRRSSRQRTPSGDARQHQHAGAVASGSNVKVEDTDRPATRSQDVYRKIAVTSEDGSKEYIFLVPSCTVTDLASTNARDVGKATASEQGQAVVLAHGEGQAAIDPDARHQLTRIVGVDILHEGQCELLETRTLAKPSKRKREADDEEGSATSKARKGWLGRLWKRT